MKRLFPLLPLLVISYCANGQDSIPAPDPGGLSIGKVNSFKIGLSLGPRFLPGTGGEVTVKYIDQSPSRDELIQVLDIPSVKVVPAFQLYAEAEVNRFFLQLGGEGFFGKFNTVAPFVGIGITPYRVKGMDVRVSARLSYGSGKYKLGDVVNNSVFFDVGGVKIYDDFLRMTYRDRYLSLIPAIGFEKNLGRHINVLLTANLHLTIRHKTRVEFYGHNGDGRKTAEPVDVDLKQVDLTFTRNGESIEKLPLYYSGLAVLASFNYAF
ncbi:MAG: hypothetical protein KA408_12080 [Flavobacteriales bacterium]|nr:hypothetical protein [Flavobacteriales bacterium]